MEENLKPTAQVLNIFRQVHFIFNCEMKEFIQKFAVKNIIETYPKYKIGKPEIYKIISTIISLVRHNKILLFRFFETKDLEHIGDNVEYYIYIYIENKNEKCIYSKDLYPHYYLEITGREHISKLFPEKYVTKKNVVDENKIYEYVREYLKALKVMLAESDFQKLLYDPDFWVYENPYK